MNQGVGGERPPGRPAVYDVLPVDAYMLPRRDSRVRSRMSLAGWRALNRYDTSFPTGVVIGKRWRRTDADGFWIGCYQRNRLGGVEIVFRAVVFVEPAEKG